MRGADGRSGKTASRSGTPLRQRVGASLTVRGHRGVATATPEKGAPPEHKEHRARQLCAAKILEEMTGPLAKCHPRLWSKRAYWLLVGTIYERLTLATDEIETEELVKLSKALAEQRRSDARRGKQRVRSEAGSATPEDNLEKMSRLVRRVYGVSIPSDQVERRNGKNRSPDGA